MHPSKYNFNDFKTALKAIKTKPTDWDDNNSLISYTEIKPIIYLPYNDRELAHYPVVGEDPKALSYIRFNKNNELDPTLSASECDLKKETWYINHNNIISGPFSVNEFVFRANEFDINQVQCKRSTDSNYVDFTKIKTFLNDSDKLDLEFRDVANKAHKENVKPQKAEKSMKFLADKKSQLQIVEIFRMISGKSKDKALSTLNSYTGMKNADNKKFLDLLISEIGTGFLSKE
ncbi:hypothetical protein CDIK_1915 [Cucumispora dikerogammari]|nr:hypothetical protein CDIK_1915 [Cucumispora dikerogammari]